MSIVWSDRYKYLYNETIARERGRKLVLREITCPSCSVNHVIKKGKSKRRQKYLSRNCERQIVGGKHSYDRSVIERVIRMYRTG